MKPQFGISSRLAGTLDALAHKRHLLWQFTLRNIQLRHRGSHLGWLWPILNPLFLMALYTFVFGIVFNGRYGAIANESGIDFALGIFLSLTVFGLLSEVLNSSAMVIVSQPNYVKKVVFPLEVLPAALVGSACFHFLIALTMVFAGVVFFGHGLSTQVLMLPLILLPLLAIGLGLAWLIAAAGVFFRDVGQITGLLSLAALYGSGVFYSLANVPANLAAWLTWNPLLHLIEQARRIVVWGLPPEWTALAWVYLAAAAIFGIGLTTFLRAKSAFAEVL